ncbi:MAG: FAD-dependent oxidoreductase [Desulfuromonadales bacterium]|nr:FAD-dependent oxidoreductase [Desulfuromonadales bacterium]
MSSLHRNPQKAAAQSYDLIIVGGGVQGVMLTLMATLRGLKPLLLERRDFGGNTSFNSLRIIHGGFRYLQKMNLSRLMQSAAERRWFLQTFPQLIKPLPCMVPLYGDGLRRPSTLYAALKIYNLITRNRNQGLCEKNQIPAGHLVSPKKVQELFPLVNMRGLQGGAIWYDAFVEDSQRLLIEVLKIACNRGAEVLNYCEATELLTNENQVAGLRATDVETGECLEFRSARVVNAAGPWCRELASTFDRDYPELFRSMLAWNVLFDRESLSTHGVAVKSDRTAHTYFLVPWKGRLMAGTGHAPWQYESKTPVPKGQQIDEFIKDINYAVTGLNLKDEEIMYVLPGLQSATETGGTNLETNAVIIDHGLRGGAQGFFSVSGVKFTTSRFVAEKLLQQVFQPSQGGPGLLGPQECLSDGWNYMHEEVPTGDELQQKLRSIVRDEAVVHIEDLLYRRTTLWENPARVNHIAPLICQFLEYESDKIDEEVSLVNNLVTHRMTIL